MSKSGKKQTVKGLTEEQLDAEVARYQQAIKSATLCERCLMANPPKSNFCAECGKALGR
jgi:hypothetical protein